MNRSMIQPYFVMSTSKYYKAVVKNIGISHFYSFTQKDLQENNMVAVPDGCMDILFNCSETKPSAELCGSVLEAVNIETDSKATYFGVRFYPGEGYAFDHIQSKDIINHQIPLTDILDAQDLFDRVVTAKNFNQRIDLFMTHYQNSIHKNQTFNEKTSIKHYMLNRIIASQGNIRVYDLAKEMGYSDRYVNKKFIEYYGMSPKNFCKIVRFQSILRSLNYHSLNSETHNLLDLSLKAGYYDQSHMIKDFNQLSKHTPTKYMDLLKESNYMKRLIEI